MLIGLHKEARQGQVCFFYSIFQHYPRQPIYLYVITVSSEGGFVKAKVKKIEGGGTFEKTFDSSEMVEMAEIEREKVQCTWEDTHEFVFMDMTTFEEKRVPKEDVSAAKFLEEGVEVKLQVYNGKVIGKELITTFVIIVYVLF